MHFSSEQMASTLYQSSHREKSSTQQNKGANENTSYQTQENYLRKPTQQALDTVTQDQAMQSSKSPMSYKRGMPTLSTPSKWRDTAGQGFSPEKKQPTKTKKKAPPHIVLQEIIEKREIKGKHNVAGEQQPGQDAFQNEDIQSHLGKSTKQNQKYPFPIETARNLEDIMEDLKDLFPKQKKAKGDQFDKAKNSYVLRSLDKLRNLDMRQKKFNDKIENIRDNLTLYEQLQLKPTVQGQFNYDNYYKQSQKLNALTERTRNQLVMISNKSEDPKFTSTFYNNKKLRVQPLAYKNEILKSTNNLLSNTGRNQVDDSFINQPLQFSARNDGYSQEKSKMKRYVRNHKILESLRKKLEQNPNNRDHLIQAFVKLNVETNIDKISPSQYESLINTILCQDYSQDIIASFEMKDFVRHGLLMEDLNLKLQIQQHKQNSQSSRSGSVLNYGNKSASNMSQFNFGLTSTPKDNIHQFQQEFLQKRKKAEDNLDRYERDLKIKTQTSNSPQNNQASFLERYIETNKVTLSNVVDRFPSIEARKKFHNEYSPTLVDTKQILDCLKQVDQEKVYRKNKLVLEKMIAERKKTKEEPKDQQMNNH